MQTLTKQRLAYSEKIKDEYAWAKETMKVLLGDTSNVFQDPDYDRKLSNYLLFNNIIDQKDFERECNPLGLDVGQFRDEIKPYNKAANKIQVLVSQEYQRPFRFRPFLVNSEGIKTKQMYRDSLLKNYVHSVIQQELQEVGVSLKEFQVDEALPIVKPEQLDKYMATSFQAGAEIRSAKILEFLYKDLSIADLKNDGFKHALISGEEYVYVGAHLDQPVLKILNPLGVFFHKSPETKYVQDSLYAGYRTYMTSGEILNLYQPYMTEDEVKRFDVDLLALNGGTKFAKDMRYPEDTWDRLLRTRYVANDVGSYSTKGFVDSYMVEHVEWMSQKRIGFLTSFTDGEEGDTTIVAENFVVPVNAARKTITKEYGRKAVNYYWNDATGTGFMLEWAWVPEVWTGTRIDNEVYIMMGPRLHQHRSLDDPYKIKLGYHGLVYNSMNAPSVSLMDRMKPFLYLIFIVMHKLKKLIAQDGGKIYKFDISMVDPKIGIEKTMYYIKELNIDIFNPLQNATMPGSNQRGTVSTSVDMSTSQYVMNYINLIASLDAQLSEVAGVTREREGQISQDAAVSNTQTNIAMSNVITEVYFQAHDKLWEQILASLIATTQAIWKGKSITKQWVLDDMSIQTLSLNPDELSNEDIGIFVANSPKEEELFRALKSLAEPLIRAQKVNFSDMVKLYKAVSPQDLEVAITQAEEKSYEREQQAAQQQIQAQQQMQQEMLAAQAEARHEDNETKIKIAEIGSFRFLQDQDADNNGVPDQLELEKFKHEKDVVARELDQKDRELDIKDKIASKPVSKG